MELLALRYSSGPESTLGALFELGARAQASPPTTSRRFLCFTLEDQFQAVKIAKETRIPAGRYPLLIRKFGGFHQRYTERFPGIHVGMVEIANVPGFTDVLLHCGNTDEHTAGCLLLGDTSNQNITMRGFLASSEAAYKRVYPRIAMAAAAAKPGAFITFEDFA